MKLTRLLGTAAIATLLTATLGACGTGNDSTDTESGDAVTLEWGFWNQGDAGNEMWQGLADEVTTTHPNITVNLSSPPFADYFTRLQSQLASNTEPCIVSMQSLRLPAFADAMEPLDDLLADTDFDEADWNPAALTALQRDGAQYALPYGISTMLMYYNTEAFAEAGIDEPQPGWTIEEFEAAAEAITEATGQPAFGQSFSDLHMYSQLLAYNDARPVTDDGNLQLDDPALQEAFTWYTELATENDVALVPASSSDVPWGEQQLVAGNTAMAVDGSWNVATNAEDSTFPMGVTTVPTAEGAISSFSANSGFGISASCDNKEEALQAILTLTSENAQETTAAAGTQPARLAAAETFFAGLTDLDEANPGYSDMAEAAINTSSETAIPFVPTSNWDAVTTEMARFFILAYTDSVTPEEALASVQSAAGN